MKAIEVIQCGDPGVLKLGERPMPGTKAGEVLIRVRAADVNRPDVSQRTDSYPVLPGASDIPGLEAAGEIVSDNLAHADNRYDLKVDDRVCALVQGGGYAKFCTASLGQVLPVPASLSDMEAAALPENYSTVWSNVSDRGLLGRGAYGADETLLVQGGPSGIRTTAIQIASALGHRVFATAGSADKCDACVKLDATRAISYKTEDFIKIVKAETGPGADVVLDMVGGSCIAREIACTADDGCIVLIALLGGAKAEVPLGDILRRRLTLTGPTLRPCPVAFRAAIVTNLYETVWPLLASGRIKSVAHGVMPAAQATQAHALMESSARIDKVMLV